MSNDYTVIAIADFLITIAAAPVSLIFGKCPLAPLFPPLKAALLR